MIHFDHDNVSEISDILHAHVEHIIDELDDDCQMVFDSLATFPKPMAANCDDLIKHENDAISMDKPFRETVNTIPRIILSQI